MSKRIFSKTLALLLCLLSIIAPLPVSANEGEIELSIISANVSGLPAILSKYDRNVPSSQEKLGGMLNDSGYDIICVQEDFGYHDTLAATMTNYPYKTYASGGVPVGDGLNIFSKYPFYNVERVAWDSYNGVFSDGSDALTPKGFIKCTVDVSGVLIDLYNVHCDAYSTEADQLTKKAQLEQLMKYINANSTDRPIIVTGDTNLTFHKDPLSEMYRIMIEEGGFVDCWVEVKNDGNYLQGDDADVLIKKWFDKFGGHDWGRWDSVERVLYKNGGGVSFSPTRFEYKIYTDNKAQIKSLTDHRMMECKLSLDTSSYQRPDIELTPESEPSAFLGFFYGCGMVARCVFLVICEAVRLYPVAAVLVLLCITAIVILAKKLRAKRKKKKADTAEKMREK